MNILSRRFDSIKKISMAGLKYLIRLFYYTGREFSRDQIITRAAALTFFTMLSLVPLLMLTFAAFKTFGGESLVETMVKPQIFKLLSTGTGEVISGAIDQLIKNSRAGTFGAIGFVFLIITAFSLMDHAEMTINFIWSENKRRSAVKRWMFYWASLSILPILVGLSVSMTAYLGNLKEVQELTEQVTPRIYALLPFGLQGLAFFLLYKYLPRNKVRFVPALTGAVAASIIWEFVKKGYLFYSSNALSYNVIYGSLATIPLFMIWLYITWIIVLVGAELSFICQNYRVIGQNIKGEDVPFQVYEILGLELMIETTRRFLKGEKALNLSEYIIGKTLQPNLVETAADKLIQSDLLKSTNGELILAKSPEQITVEEVIQAIKSGGGGEYSFFDDPGHRDINDFLDTLDMSSKNIRKEWHLKRIIDEKSGLDS